MTRKSRAPKRQVLLLSLAVALTGAGSGARAASTSMTPPYDSGSSERSCSPVPTATCAAGASASKRTGALTLDLAVEGPAAGAAPGVGSAYGLARILATYRLRSPAAAVRIRARLLVESASASVSGVASGVGLGPIGGFASIDAIVSSEHASCGSCGSSGHKEILWSSGGTGSRHGEIILETALAPEKEGPIPSGPIAIDVSVRGFASLVADNGSVKASGRFGVAEIVVDVLRNGPDAPRIDGVPEVAISGTTPFSPGCTEDGAQVGTEVEPQVAVNPLDVDNVIAIWQQDRFSGGGSRGLVLGVTQNGGRTWKRVILPGTSLCAGGAYERATDPWISFGGDGTAYAISLSFDGAGRANALLVSRSEDGGRTWSAPAVAAEDVALMLNDKEAITADPRAPNHVYAVWAKFAEFAEENGAPLGTHLSRSTDAGRTWSRPAPIHLSPAGVAQGNEIVVLPDGRLVDVFGDISYTGNSSISAIRSSDRGATWSAPVRIADMVYDWSVYTDEGSIRAPVMPSVDVGPDGTLYVVWPEVIGGSVLMSRSSDGGLSWSAPITVSEETGAFLPTVAVAADGTVGVVFDDLRHDSRGDGAIWTEVWFRSSRDGGATWTEKHVAGPFDMTHASESQGFFVGDYQGLVSMGSDFGAIFAQATPSGSRAHRQSDIFWARITPIGFPRGGYDRARERAARPGGRRRARGGGDAAPPFRGAAHRRRVEVDRDRHGHRRRPRLRTAHRGAPA